MKTTSIFCLLAFLLTAILTESCKKEENHVPECNSTDSLTFDADIQPIVQVKCQNLNCHEFGSKWGDYSTYAGFGPLFSNGDFAKRVLQDQSMPRGSSLTDQQLDLFQCWVNQGYPEK